MKEINVTRSSLPPFEEYVEEIRPLWESRWLTNRGVKHRELEERLRAATGAERLVLTANGHLALEAAIRALGLAGDIITTPFTFASTTHAIVRAGCRPVFCDIDPRTMTLDPARLEALITPATVAVLGVHVYGFFCDVAGIGAIAARHGLPVIYDAAHAFGATLDGRGPAAFGDAVMFSFHATKVFHTIEGGALAFRDAALQETLEREINFGLAGEDAPRAGGNAKMNEFQAAMGLCNLRHLETEIASRAAADARYRARLGALDGVEVPAPQPGVGRNYAYFPVLFASRARRDAVTARLARAGIRARKYFYPLTSTFSVYGGDPGATPQAARAADRVLTLPLYAGLGEDEVDTVCDLLKEALRAGGDRGGRV